LEVTTDGRHITFLLVSLYEAGYGVQVVGSPAVFRELICLRKSAPIPFVIGGKEREVGISISDKSGFNHRGHGEHGGGKRILLDYDFFSGLTTPRRQGSRSGDCREQPERARREGSSESTCPKRHETGKIIDSKIIETTEETEVAAGLRLSSQASASEPDSLTSKLAHAPVSESLIRSADGPTSLPTTSYSPLVTALRAPYFMHPSVYHKGLHKGGARGAEKSKHVPCSATSLALDSRPSTLDSAAKRRRFRIGFFGTHDREFYTKHYHFPGMNRFEILEVFLQKFGNRMKPLRGFPRDWDPCEIAVSIDARGGDRRGKTFLPQDHYFEALQECDFVLSPPGWCMPVSHNLIEAMFCGAIPITNGGAFMVEPLSDGETCLEFKDVEGLTAAVERALAMGVGEVSRMQQAVRDYYERFLEPEAWFPALIGLEVDRFLVNAEEKSVPLAFPEKNAN
jgi:hypothetical protein